MRSWLESYGSVCGPPSPVVQYRSFHWACVWLVLGDGAGTRRAWISCAPSSTGPFCSHCCWAGQVCKNGTYDNAGSRKQPHPSLPTTSLVAVSKPRLVMNGAHRSFDSLLFPNSRQGGTFPSPSNAGQSCFYYVRRSFFPLSSFFFARPLFATAVLFPADYIHRFCSPVSHRRSHVVRGLEPEPPGRVDAVVLHAGREQHHLRVPGRRRRAVGVGEPGDSVLRSLLSFRGGGDREVGGGAGTGTGGCRWLESRCPHAFCQRHSTRDT